MISVTVTRSHPDLSHVSNKLKTFLRAQLAAATVLGWEEARRLCVPPRTVPRQSPDIYASGDLKESIQWVVDPLTMQGVIWTDSPYAPFVEFGTGIRGSTDANPQKSPESPDYNTKWAGMVSQPFLYPAALKVKKVFAGRMESALNREIGGMGW
jgi:hypothetical protein